MLNENCDKDLIDEIEKQLINDNLVETRSYLQNRVIS